MSLFCKAYKTNTEKSFTNYLEAAKILQAQSALQDSAHLHIKELRDPE